MASLVTLQQLRDQSRARADMQNSGFVKPEELDQYINSAARELYDILVSRYEDYYLLPTPTNFTVTVPVDPSVNASIDLPADFYKLRGLDTLIAGSQWAPMVPFMFQERNRLQNPLLYPNYEQASVMYRIYGSKVVFLGFTQNIGGGVMRVRMWYIPKMTALVNPTDTFDGINGWEEHIVVNVAAMMKQKEESDVSALMARKAQLEDRIKNMADNRDEGVAQRVTDMSVNIWGPFPRF